MKKVKLLLIPFILLLSGSVFAQENYFENIQIIPATCDVDNGSIQIDPPLGYVEFMWVDSTLVLNRDSLAPGTYTISGEDEDGCIEVIILEVPDISDCEFEITSDYVLSPYPSGGGPGIKWPCRMVSFSFTLDGEEVPVEYLDILWEITVPMTIFPYTMTYYSTQPTVPVYVSGTTVRGDIGLISEYGEIPCCTFSDSIYVTTPCPVDSFPPRIYVYKSTFRDSANTSSVPGLVELLVYGDGTCGDSTDIRGYIIDDNNGELIPPQDSTLQDGSTIHVDTGYIKFADHSNWAAVPNGSIITIYEPSHSLNEGLAEIDDPTDSNSDYNYIVSAENSTYFTGHHSSWNYDDQRIDYDSSTLSLSWELIEANGGAGAMQVRYPDGDYCHGISYGETTASIEENLFPLYISDKEYPYCHIYMTELSYLDKTAFSISQTSGGFDPGEFDSDFMEEMFDYLRDCDSIILPYAIPIEDKPVQAQVQLPRSEKTGPAKKESSQEDHLRVYPNPFQQFLHVEYKARVPGQGSIRIFNSQGKIVRTIRADCNGKMQSQTVDFGNGNVNGLFFILFQTPDEQFISEKVLLMNLR